MPPSGERGDGASHVAEGIEDFKCGVLQDEVN